MERKENKYICGGPSISGVEKWEKEREGIALLLYSRNAFSHFEVRQKLCFALTTK